MVDQGEGTAPCAGHPLHKDLSILSNTPGHRLPFVAAEQAEKSPSCGLLLITAGWKWPDFTAPSHTSHCCQRAPPRRRRRRRFLNFINFSVTNRPGSIQAPRKRGCTNYEESSVQLVLRRSEGQTREPPAIFPGCTIMATSLAPFLISIHGGRAPRTVPGQRKQ